MPQHAHHAAAPPPFPPPPLQLPPTSPMKRPLSASSDVDSLPSMLGAYNKRNRSAPEAAFRQPWIHLAQPEVHEPVVWVPSPVASPRQQQHQQPFSWVPSSPAAPPPQQQQPWPQLSIATAAPGTGQLQDRDASSPPVQPPTPRQQSSQYRGVTHHCYTRRFECHLWDPHAPRKFAKGEPPRQAPPPPAGSRVRQALPRALPVPPAAAATARPALPHSPLPPPPCPRPALQAAARGASRCTWAALPPRLRP